MADWIIAFDWMMDNEDAQRACRPLPDASPKGVVGPCFAISGINSGAFPAEYAAIAALPQQSRAPAVRQFYQERFWNQWYAQLNSDDLCKRVFDFAINAGSVVAVRTLQKAVNQLAAAGAAQIFEDGIWGPQTVVASNGADPVALVAAFIQLRVGFYRAIAAATPAKEKYLQGWIERAER